MLDSKRLSVTKECTVKDSVVRRSLFISRSLVLLNAFTGFSIWNIFFSRDSSSDCSQPLLLTAEVHLPLSEDAALAFLLLKIMKRFLEPSEN